MFDVRPMPAQVDPTLLKRAALAEPATIGHFRLRGFPDTGIRPIIPSDRVVGTAVTLLLPGADSTILHHAIRLLRPGDILVIDRAGDRTHACVGGGVAVALSRTGIHSVIIDGYCTDPGELRGANLNLWARGISSITTRILGNGGEMNVPVSIGGAVVNAGDLVIADEAGIVFLPPDEASAAIEKAIGMQAAEQSVINDVGVSIQLADLSGATKLVEAKLVSRD